MLDWLRHHEIVQLLLIEINLHALMRLHHRLLILHISCVLGIRIEVLLVVD